MVEWASRSGAVVRPYAGVIADPAHWCPVPADALRWRAAALAAGPNAALSHTTALAVWRLPVPAQQAVHVLTSPGRRIRVAGIVGHRRRGFTMDAPDVVCRQGVPVTGLDRGLVDAWPLLTADRQRAPVLTAVGDRMTTPARVRAALTPSLGQRRDLLHLLDLLDAGCRSELELWGYLHVFDGPEFSRLRWQVPIRVGRRTCWLDAYDEESATNFELDGARYHGSPSARDRDIKRDAQLARVGVHAVRFGHDQLNAEPGAVRSDAIQIMAVRRAQRRAAAG